MATPNVNGSGATPAAGAAGGGDKMQVMKRIVAAQDAFISDLERKNKQLAELVSQGRAREKEFKHLEGEHARVREAAERWRAECQARDKHLRETQHKLDSSEAEASALRKQVRDQSHAQSSRAASIQAAEARFKAAQAAWSKERGSLVGLIEKSNAMGQALETELRKSQLAAAAERKTLESQAAAEREAGRAEGASSVKRTDDHIVAQLRGELQKARTAQAAAEDVASRLRHELSVEVKRIGKLAQAERDVNAKEKKALRAQLGQLKRVTQQRSNLADQERSALETELHTATSRAQEKHNILERQLAQLMDEVESLTRAHINGQESGTAASGTEYDLLEARLADVLKAKEESEAQRLAAEKTLLEEIASREALRDEREAMQAAEAHKRIQECEQTIDGWEHKQAALVAELQAAQSQAEAANQTFTDRFAVLQSELDAARQENAELAATAEKQAEEAREEVAALRAECDRLREQSRAAEAIGRNQDHAREREVETLQVLLRKVQAERMADATRQEAHSQSLSMDLERARTIADDRGRDLLKLKESATQKEEELSTALKEAVDALHAAQADRAEVEERVLAELADVREKLDGANEQAVSAATEAAATIEALSNDVASLSRGMAKAAAEHKRQLSDARAAASAAKEAATLTAAQLKNQLTVALTDLKAVQEAAAAEKERLETKIAQLQRDGERAAQVTQASEAAYQAELESLRHELEAAHSQASEAQERIEAALRAADGRAEAAVAKAWAAREAGSKAASASVDTVVQQLQSRLENVASQRAKEAKAAQAELRVLREARASASMDLAQTHGLWNEERRRMQDTVDALQAKATREQEMRSSRANLVEEELAALRGVKERISASQETILDALNSELDGLKRERAALAKHEDDNKTAVAELKTKYEKELARLTAVQRRQAELAASAQAQRDASRRQDMERIQQECEVAKSDCATAKETLQRMRQSRAREDAVTASELKELRSELHHLRRVANEQQMILTKEKQALLDELQRVKSLQQSEQASVVALHREQRQAWQHAADEKVKVAEQEVSVLRKELGAARRRVQELSHLHAAETQNQQAGVAILRQMEAERERLTGEQNQVHAALLSKLQAHCQEISALSKSERESLQAEIDSVREEMAAKEQVLSRQLRAAQQAALARLGRSPALVAEAAARGDKQAAQALVAQIRVQESSKVQRLKAENARLSAALEAAHRDAERREQQSLADFRDIRQSFSRFQQLHINAVAPRQHHDGAAARRPKHEGCHVERSSQAEQRAASSHAATTSRADAPPSSSTAGRARQRQLFSGFPTHAQSASHN